jgi:hypothetical protein
VRSVTAASSRAIQSPRWALFLGEFAMSSRSFLRKSAASLAATMGLGVLGSEASAQITLPPNLTIGVETITPGLHEGRVAGAFNITEANPADRGIKLEPIMAQTTGNGNVEPWPDNTTYIYTGQMFFPDNGVAGDNISEFAFAEHVDDSTQIKIDGIERLNNTVWNAVNTTGRLELSSGWHDVEFRFGEGTGGWGPSTDTAADADPANPWDNTLGLGVDFTSPIEADLKQPTYTRPVDNGSGNLFRVKTYNTDTSRDNQNVNVTANATLTVLQSRTVPLGTLTVANGVTLTADSPAGSTTFTEANLGATASFAINSGTVVTGPVKSAAAVTSITKTGAGTLSVPTRSGSTMTGTPTINVNGGTLNIGVAAGVSSLGTSPFVLNGGTLALSNDTLVASGAGLFNITGEFYRDDDLFNPLIAVPPDSTNTFGWSGLDSKAQLDTKLTGRTPAAVRPINTEINFPRAGGSLVDGGTNDEPNDIFNTGGGNVGVSLTGNDDFATRFTGKLNVTTAGATEFLLMSNDGAAMFIDMDTGAGVNWQKVVDNNRHTGTGDPVFQGHYSGSSQGVSDQNLTVAATAPAISNPAAPNLAVGVYDFIVGSFNKNANEYGIELYWTPSGGTRSIIPYAAGGPVTLNNTVTVSGNSGLDVRAPSATLANLRIDPGGSLRVTGAPLTTAVTATGAGTVRIGSGGATVNLTELIDGGAAVNFMAGEGRVNLTRTGGPGAGFGATSTVGAVTGGTLVVTNSATGNTLGTAPVTLAGGTLELNVAAISGTGFVAGLREGRVPGAFNITDPNPADRGIVLEPIRAQVVGNGNVEPFPDNTTYIYTGQMLFPDNGGGQSRFAFAECFDDSTQIKIDGVERLNNNVWNVANTTGELTVPAGWHDVEFRFGEGGGGWGPSGQDGWVQAPAPGVAPGFGVDFTLPIDPSIPPIQAEFARPIDNGSMNLFRTTAFQVPTFQSNVTATENSRINVAGVAAAVIGNVSVADGKTLTVLGNGLTVGNVTTGAGGAVSFTGQPSKVAGSLNGAGTVLATSGMTLDFTASGAASASTGAPKLDIARDARMNFTPGAGNTFQGSTVSAIQNEGTLRATNGVTDLSGAVVTTNNVPGTIIGGGLSSVVGEFYDTTAVPLPGAPDSANTFGWSGLDSKAQFDTALAGKTPLATRDLSALQRAINFPWANGNLVDGGTNDFGPEELFNVEGGNLNVPLTGNTDFVVRFTGKLNVLNAGVTGFGMAANDGAVMFLDMDQGPGANWVKVADHNRFSTTGGAAFDEHGSAGVGNPGTPAIPQTAAPNLSVGTYDFAVGFYNANANEGGVELFWVPAGGTRGIIPLGGVSGATLVQVDTGATLKLGALVGANDVKIEANGRLELHGPTSKMLASGLSIAGTPTAPTATLDLTDSAIALDYPTAGPSPAADIRSRIIAGRGAPGLIGSWDGKGITSSTSAAAADSTSVGYAVNGDMPLGAVTDFRGVAVDPTTVLIRHTRIGDANLDGVVNDDDVTIVGAVYAPGVANASWANGDFDYNGFVDDDDVTLLGALYNPGLPPVPAPEGGGGVAAVPEPSTWLMLTLGGLGAGLFGWRRRKK